MKLKIAFYYKIIFTCLFLSGNSNVLLAQLANNVFTDTLRIKSTKIILIDLQFPVDSIFALTVNSKELQYDEFVFDKINQIVHFKNDELIGEELVISYKAFPIKRELIRKNQPQVFRDTTTKQQFTTIKKTHSQNLTDDIFGSKIERSGVLTRGFSVGSNKDFTLNSGLRLQLAGQLSDDVEVTAVLSDQSSPIQPEGNTRSLQEIDKVYIELKHKNAQAIFGDFQYTQKVGMFGVVDKKLQGLTSTTFLNQKNFANVSYASAKGKFKSQQFNGIDGVQGPYRLTGENNERDIIVLAGTEKVYINGEEKIRGENYDYTIDYSTGEIFFTPRNVITGASRIKVDFEYSDRKYERNFFGSVVNGSVLSDKFQIGFSYFREGDNQDLPIDVSLSEDDKRILAQSGNDRLAASKSGVKFVGYDTTGKPAGVYRLRDTLIAGQSYSFFEFNPGSDSAFYNVSFSYIGEGKGDYVRLGLGRFKYVGPNNGNYAPLILLPMPELKQIGNFYSKLFLSKYFIAEGELSISSFDRNRFSLIDDNKNKGKAYNYKLSLDSLNINLSSFFDGNISATYLERKTESTFSPLTRIYEVEYERNWNLILTSQNSDEFLRELNFRFFKQKFDSRFSYGKLKRGNDFLSNRFTTTINSELFERFELNYFFSGLNTRSSQLNSNYQKNFFNLKYNFQEFTPYLKLEIENKFDRVTNDSLLITSFRFYDLTFGLNSAFVKYIDFNSAFNFRKDLLPLHNKIETEANSYNYQLNLRLKNISNVNSSIDLAFRQKKYSEQFKSLGRLNNQSLAVKYLARGIFFQRFFQTDLYYEASSQRSAKLERVFLRVPKGTGQYIYKGDLNGNGIADEFEFEPTKFEGDYILTTYPTDELFPVIDLKASARFKFDFRNLLIDQNIQRYLKPFSTETYLRVEENSTDPKESNVYLIRIKTFQKKSTTIRGNNLIQQDINLFEYNPDFCMLFRLIERRGFSRFSLTDERRFQQEKIIQLRWKFVKEFANQSEINISKNNLSSTAFSVRNFLIKQTTFTSKLFYYPYNNIEAGFKFEIGQSKDFYPQIPIVVDFNAQELTLTIMYSMKGKINLSFERMEMISNQTLTYIPFELTRGYMIGKNYIWQFSFDYQIANNFQTNVVYNGRVQGNNNPIHTATAEIRAYF
ncbi:MAG: hypothetical protein ACPL25_08080 [Ignavibacteria bacterium]